MFPGLNVTLSSDYNADKTRNVIQECLYMKGCRDSACCENTNNAAGTTASLWRVMGTQATGPQRSVYWEVGAVGGGGGRPAASPGWEQVLVQ